MDSCNSSNEQPAAMSEEKIDQQMNDDDDAKHQSKEPVKDTKSEEQNVSKTEKNHDNSGINEPVIEKRDTKSQSKDSKKREKTQSKDVEEFNIITRSTSKKIAKQTKSGTLETNETTMTTTTTSTTTPVVLETNNIDIIMARKLRNIVKFIGKHDYFESQSSLTGEIKKPIFIENIMTEIDNDIFITYSFSN
ncbi:hypothetical protein BLA29_008339 [Euroglyphus maynei]|uniref:Uncharacterized protein n=1 Tax=Euroglyphus maynei TaxID=6958 RepID=A0A1Y3BPH9_EURMA|nr:hypothetical protein BLA29_008339 [Euroglyphus maynei]